MAQRTHVTTPSSDSVVYLHGDHLGSVSVVTGAGASLIGSQRFDPWGKVIAGGVSQTRKNYTGQELDTTGLLYYNARYYDPNLGRFLSADTVVPGNAAGGMDGVALKGLTVDFHEPGFAGGLNGENRQAFWFQMDEKERQDAGSPWGPVNPQALNRYSYVWNNPLRYDDVTGHSGGLPGQMRPKVEVYDGTYSSSDIDRLNTDLGATATQYGSWQRVLLVLQCFSLSVRL